MAKIIKRCVATYLWDGMYVLLINNRKPFIISEEEMWVKYSPEIVDWVELE